MLCVCVVIHVTACDDKQDAPRQMQYLSDQKPNCSFDVILTVLYAFIEE